ncbi:DNA or RNA helicase of superfamily II [Stutzerimonas nosocomialis]|uniref:DNA or RNA helicase of superfamily II n=1 Tax=Stutzerimonas nosocomialis TaxID=1056496 RepID=A0A5R9QEP6_9GAMM|nr:cysteine-rich CWC family protein [Stutzerimonas nosocomialis]TLX53152.1 DNA or RNA helicase of superfamily II [Stutzerimonas nosocomialis]TLX63594.1 DNA or RNA helicase of superfamily II [Stutzerimonas nosocomialis]
MSDTHAPPPVDPSRCPVCGQSNGCGLASGDASAPCWCFAVTLDARQLADLPPQAQGKACLCPRCARGERPDPSR